MNEKLQKGLSILINKITSLIMLKKFRLLCKGHKEGSMNQINLSLINAYELLLKIKKNLEFP